MSAPTKIAIPNGGASAPNDLETASTTLLVGGVALVTFGDAEGYQ